MLCIINEIFKWAGLFVLFKLFQPSLSNTLVYYENSEITDKKFYKIDQGPILNILRPSETPLKVLYSRVGSWPFPQTLD
jgi:hypothetical protein